MIFKIVSVCLAGLLSLSAFAEDRLNCYPIYASRATDSAFNAGASLSLSLGSALVAAVDMFKEDQTYISDLGLAGAAGALTAGYYFKRARIFNATVAGTIAEARGALLATNIINAAAMINDAIYRPNLRKQIMDAQIFLNKATRKSLRETLGGREITPLEVLQATYVMDENNLFCSANGMKLKPTEWVHLVTNLALGL